MASIEEKNNQELKRMKKDEKMKKAKKEIRHQKNIERAIETILQQIVNGRVSIDVPNTMNLYIDVKDLNQEIMSRFKEDQTEYYQQWRCGLPDDSSLYIGLYLQIKKEKELITFYFPNEIDETQWKVLLFLEPATLSVKKYFYAFQSQQFIKPSKVKKNITKFRSAISTE